MGKLESIGQNGNAKDERTEEAYDEEYVPEEDGESTKLNITNVDINNNNSNNNTNLISIKKNNSTTSSQAAAAKEKIITKQDSSTDLNNRKLVKRRILRNLLVFSFSYLLQFMAINALSNLQSTINAELGVYTLTLGAISFALSCLIFPAILAKYGGFKWPLIICECFMTLFVLANYYPRYWTMLPAAILLGVSNSVLWTFQGSLISHLAAEYTSLSKRKSDNVLIRFFGFFYIIYQLNQIIGNTISGGAFYFYNELNQTNLKLENSTRLCGAHDCPIVKEELVTLQTMPKAVYLLCSIFLCFSVIGILAMVFFFDNIKPTKDDKTWFETAFEVLKIFRDPKKILLLPIYAFSCSFGAFLIVDMSNSYIACQYGVQHIGYWFSVWGVSSSVCSITMSSLTKYIKKTVFLLIITVCTIVLLIFLFYWKTSYHMSLIYALAILFGFFEAGWGAVLMTLIGVSFSDNSGVAYANNRFCSSLFYLVSFGYSRFLCVRTKIFILVAFGVLAFVSLIVFEYIVNKESKYKKVSTNKNVIYDEARKGGSESAAPGPVVKI